MRVIMTERRTWSADVELGGVKYHLSVDEEDRLRIQPYEIERTGIILPNRGAVDLLHALGILLEERDAFYTQHGLERLG